MAKRDELDELDIYIAERDERRPGFAALHAGALSRREMAREMATVRESFKKTQTEIGALVGTSQAQIARLEKGDADSRISSMERYAAALGLEIEYVLKPADGAAPARLRAASGEAAVRMKDASRSRSGAKRAITARSTAKRAASSRSSEQGSSSSRSSAKNATSSRAKPNPKRSGARKADTRRAAGA